MNKNSLFFILTLGLMLLEHLSSCINDTNKKNRENDLNKVSGNIDTITELTNHIQNKFRDSMPMKTTLNYVTVNWIDWIGNSNFSDNKSIYKINRIYRNDTFFTNLKDPLLWANNLTFLKYNSVWYLKNKDSFGVFYNKCRQFSDTISIDNIEIKIDWNDKKHKIKPDYIHIGKIHMLGNVIISHSPYIILDEQKGLIGSLSNGYITILQDYIQKVQIEW